MRLRRALLISTLLGPMGVAGGPLSGTLLSGVALAQAAERAVADAGEELSNRVATFRDAAGQAYFAASLQAPADESALRLVSGAPARLSILFDTSASQTGDFRADQLAALRGVLAGLRPDDEIQLFASDVAVTELSGPILASDESGIREALAKLGRRLPLGNTNLAAALETARDSILAGPADRTRGIVYIGDGATMRLAHDRAKFETLVDALRADRVSIHSIAIGPTQNIELMATLANHTGGYLASIGPAEAEIVDQIGRQMAAAAIVSPIWIDSLELPAGFTAVQGERLPPLRIDRDTLIFGTTTAVADGPIRVSGQTARGQIAFTGQTTVEADHPDFAFLPGLVSGAQENHGLLLPTAGSGMLRQVASLMRQRADQLAAEGEAALEYGSQRGAEAIAKMALENDPTNEAAQRLQERIVKGERLVAQNQNDPFADPFGAADAAAEDPFGAAPTTPAAQPPAAQPPAAQPPAARPPVAAPPAAPPASAVAPPAARPAPAVAPPPAPRRPAPVPQPVAGSDEFLEPSSGILDGVAAQRAQTEGRLRAEVRAELLEARRQLETNPIGVSGSLKVLLSQLENQADIDPQVRQELLGQVRSAIQAASRREASAIEAEASAAQVAAAATQTEMLLQEAFRREDRLKTLSNQLNALVTEGRARYADTEITPAMAEIARADESARVLANQSVLWVQMLNSATRMREIRLRRQRNFLDAFALVEEANVPFVDDVPMQYPDAETWQRLSRRRMEKYAKLELLGSSPNERRIYEALDKEIPSFDANQEPLDAVLRKLGEENGITFEVDRRVPEVTNVQVDEPITLSRQNVSLRALITAILKSVEGGEDLTYEVEAETLYIMPREVVEPKARIYPVGDLGSPIQSGGMMGGMGGGMMGGMGGGMGGMGGGMGGMGGGMGGMGGMGGGMGGMGGGMMAVPDEVSLGQKSSAVAPTKAPAAAKTPAVPNQAAVAPAPAVTDSPAAATKQPLPHHRIRLPGVAEPVSFEAWQTYFSGLKLPQPEDVLLHDQRVLATVQYFTDKVTRAEEAGDTAAARLAFVQNRDFLAAAILSGHVQPWMHMAYAVSLKATDGEPAEIERALLSAADLADSPEDMLMVADRLRREGFEESALRMCRDVSTAVPYRREPYVMGLRLAEQLEDIDALLWACRGILSQAWPKGSEKIENDARLLARATHQMLVDQGRKPEAERFMAELQQATAHDLMVRISWTGDADIDIAVEEPSGTVCSSQTPNSPAGGSFLGDGFPGLEAADEGGILSETYVCPQGYSGTYRILIRRVWGNVTSGQVTVDVLSDVGRPSQRYIRHQVDLTEKDALVLVEVKDGTRKTEVGEAQLAHLRNLRDAEVNHVLGQLADAKDPQVMGQFMKDMANIQSLGYGSGSAGGYRPFIPGVIPGVGPAGFGRGPAVGYMPVITVIPEGAMMFASAIVSADRRYVRVTPNPFFSQITEINTFNFVSGEEGTGGAAGGIGGIGGGGGGIGGGLGGGGAL